MSPHVPATSLTVATNVLVISASYGFSLIDTTSFLSYLSSYNTNFQRYRPHKIKQLPPLAPAISFAEKVGDFSKSRQYIGYNSSNFVPDFTNKKVGWFYPFLLHELEIGSQN